MSDTGVFQRLVTRLSGGFVLAFHEIAPDRLVELVECLRPARPVPLSELVERSKARQSTAGLFAITIDDGVGENVRALSQVFLARSWPASFYLPTSFIDTGEAMPFQLWRGLQPLLPRKVLALKSGLLDLTLPNAVDQLARKMELQWHTQRMDTYLPLLKELAEFVPGANESITALTPPPVSWAEVEKLSRTGIVAFESHGVSHAAMSSLADEELIFELKSSRDTIAGHTGLPCRHLAYPFGSPLSIGTRAAAVAETFYDSATTMTLGRVDFANPWLMPRIPFYPENSKLIARLKILLKCGSMKPLKWSRAA